jgi:hypothetical protein
VINIFSLGSLLVMASSMPALAYIDPVSSSILLQALIGGIATALVAVRRVRNRIIGLFRGKSEPIDPNGKDKDV